MKRFSLLLALACGLALQSCEDADFAGMLSFTDASANDRFDASMKLLEANPVAADDILFQGECPIRRE